MKAFGLALLLYFSASQSIARRLETKPQASDIIWIKTVLSNWDSVCRYTLHLTVDSLPWIIFYDSAYAWHLHPDEKLLPTHTKSSYRFQFAEKNYDLYKVANAPYLWVPERKAINFSSLLASTMPYDNNKKTFFIAPLPSLFHQLAASDQSLYLDLLFLGTCCHELTHTLQLPFALPQLIKVQERYKLPENIDDNTIENTFNKNDAYLKLFNAEKEHLWKAVSAESNDVCKSELLKALELKDERNKLFARDSIGYKYLDDIFLSLEGSAMWVQYQVTLRHAPKKQSWQETLNWLLERTSSWSQEEGLGLFLLINRLIPNWESRFFNEELPSPFQILQDASSK